MPTPVVTARSLSKRFGATEVVRGIDFDVSAGRCFGVLGPNGAGKTTTLRMTLGTSPISGGRLEVFGRPMPECGREVRRRMGVVPQMDNLDPDFTVEENLRIHGAYFGIDHPTLDRRIAQLLDFVELGSRRKATINALSGGMKRRLTIARALINDPQLVVLDEPTTGLDPQARHVIWARLRDLLNQGKTLLLTTHYMEEAERLCDELVIMDHGRILDQGSPQELIGRHCEREVVEVRSGGTRAGERLEGCSEARLETVGDTLYAYADNARPLVERLEGEAGLVFLHRPASLEDVFLRLTGRELRD
ncbi:ATP-binding cassette domain-containing protein [Endothiovibrio diazotrophicus]